MSSESYLRSGELWESNPLDPRLTNAEPFAGAPRLHKLKEHALLGNLLIQYKFPANSRLYPFSAAADREGF